MTLKNITLSIAIFGLILLVVGIIADNQRLGVVGINLAVLFGILRALLSVTRLF